MNSDCANACPYNVRFFDFFNPVWEKPLHLQLNPDVSLREVGVKGIPHALLMDPNGIVRFEGMPDYLTEDALDRSAGCGYRFSDGGFFPTHDDRAANARGSDDRFRGAR